MTTSVRAALASLLLACCATVPASAGISPYVRLDYGGNELRMTDGDKLIMDNQAELQSAGYPAQFHKVGSAYGSSGSAGLWLFPAFRVGAIYSQQKAIRVNRLHVPGQIFYEDDLDLRMTEIGGEAALRFSRLAGFTIGASVAQGRAQLIEGFSVEDGSGQYYSDATAERTKTTYGAYIGFDQTNPHGVAGFVRAGFQYRDMGRMPSKFVESDGTTSAPGTGSTIWMDYSGIYFKVGLGYDLVH